MNNKPIILSEEQKVIVELVEGQHLVLAPPGTGKTELLAQRVNLALNRGIRADEMICLTFTNRAAKGMKERIEERHPNNKVFIGNIHHFGSTFLSRNKLIPQFTSLLDEEDSDLLIREAMSIENYQVDAYLSDLLRLNTQIKQLKLNFPEEIILPPSKLIPSLELAKKVCLRYEQLKVESSLLDFDDLLTYTYYYLTSDNNNFSLSKYSWIQVDEVQDLNPIQWEIIKLVAGTNVHLVFFGDYEQAIFSFMGAKLERLHTIEKECKIHNLQKNFRSPSYLLQIYIDYAKTHLSPKWKKDPVPNKIEIPDQNDLLLIEVNGENNNEANYIINKILPYLTKRNKKQTAILVRWNKTADLFSKILKSVNVDHFNISGFDLFRRKVIKNIVAFLGCMENELDRVSWYRMFNIFGKIPTLKESRHFVNSLFDIGLYPVDYLSNKNNSQFMLEGFLHLFKNERLVIFDTETTGLNTQKDEIIQIAAVEIIKGEIGNTFEVFIKTDKELGESENIHRISKEFLISNGIDSREGLSKFNHFVNGDVLIAHNLEYDWKILQSYSTRKGFDLQIGNPKTKFDTLEISRKLYPKLNSYKLIDLISSLKLQGVNSHNALEDVLATANLTKHLAVEADKRITPQKDFSEKNKIVLQIFYDNFFPIWNKWKSQINQQTSFTIIIKDFLDYLKNTVNYSIETDDAYHLSKLLRHMQIKCGNKSLSDLLKYHVLDYKLYKEADLVIGDEKIVISTVHKAKGLEFENVIVPECINDTYPSWVSNTIEEKEEDGRTFYVALSRAMKRLILTYHTISINKYGKTFPRSRTYFLGCIEKHFKKINV